MKQEVSMFGKNKEADNTSLNRVLKTRHLTMIAVGGAIGDGLFLSTGSTLGIAGPLGALIAFIIIGVMVYSMVHSLGEMAVFLPSPGAFQTWSAYFVNPGLGFTVGWNYWFSWAVVTGIEIIVAGIAMSYWFPDVPMVIWCVVFSIVLLGLNLFSARAYGETEYWFAGIKVVAVIVFIIVGILMIFGVIGNAPNTGLSNFTAYGGLFPKGAAGIVACLFTAVYTFWGTEIIGVTAGESEEPQKSIPKAVRTVFWRILIFYLGSIFVMGALLPYENANVMMSPFTAIFRFAGIPFADSVFNMIVLIAVLSCANSGIYAASRMLYSLAKEGKAPKSLTKTNERGVPVRALVITAAVGLLAFLSSFISADRVYLILVSATGIATIFSWASVAFANLRFRGWLKKTKLGVGALKFKAPFYPFGPIFTAFVCCCTIIGTFINEDSRMTAFIGVPLFFVLWGIGLILQKNGNLKKISDEEIIEQSTLDNSYKEKLNPTND